MRASRHGLGSERTRNNSGGQAHADVIKGGMKVADAVDKAFKRTEQIFAKMTFD